MPNRTVSLLLLPRSAEHRIKGKARLSS